MNGKGAPPGIELSSTPGLVVDGDPVPISAHEVLELVREEFAHQGEVLPGDDKLVVLAQVATGYLRTCPLPESVTPQGQTICVAAFVTACLGWWTRDVGGFGRIATFLDDAFHQRETGVPPAAAMEMLLTVTTGLMRRRQVNPTHAAQLAMADWITSLYLAGRDDW